MPKFAYCSCAIFATIWSTIALLKHLLWIFKQAWHNFFYVAAHFHLSLNFNLSFWADQQHGVYSSEASKPFSQPDSRIARLSASQIARLPDSQLQRPAPPNICFRLPTRRILPLTWPNFHPERRVVESRKSKNTRYRIQKYDSEYRTIWQTTVENRVQ